MVRETVVTAVANALRISFGEARMVVLECSTQLNDDSAQLTPKTPSAATQLDRVLQPHSDGSYLVSMRNNRL